MATLFSKIVANEIPCYKVHESEDFLAFLDIMPLAHGHVLVIPKKETDYIFDIEDDELGRMMVFAKQVAVKIKSAFPCNRIGVTVIGLEVPHAHIHLIPINKLDDMNFSKEKLVLTEEVLINIAAKIADS